MNTYELTYIINPVRSDEQTRDLVGRVRTFLDENGAEILAHEEWGSRRLAYTIDRKRNGYYVNVVYRAEGDIVARLERTLQINDDVLRYLTLKMDAKMERHFATRDQRRASEEEAEA